MRRTATAARSMRNDGFTLVEVILAMMIIVGVMASLLAVVVSSLGTIAQARQRQTATALATQAIERLRALPYDTVTLATPGDTPDPGAIYAVLDSGQYWLDTTQPAGQEVPSLSLHEELVVNGVSGRVEDIDVDEVTYRVHRYVSLAPVTPGGQQAFQLTVLVSWSSAVSRGPKMTTQRSVAFSPSGCLSTAQSPFAAPCQEYFTANAGQTLGGVTVTHPTDSTLPIVGFDSTGGRLLEFGFANQTATVLVEQTATGNAGATTTSARQISVSDVRTGGVTAAAAVDSDPSSTPDQHEVEVTSGQTSSTQALVGAAGALEAVPSTADSGRAAAAVFADGSHCVGINGTGLQTGPNPDLRPCSSSHVAPGGSSATLLYKPVPAFGFNGVFAPLVTAAPDSTPARAVAAHVAFNNPGVCPNSSPEAPRCAYGAANRELGTVVIGAAVVGSTAPAGFDARGIVTVSGLREELVVEEGLGARTPAYSREGVLSIWNGTGYESIDLSSFQDLLGTAQTWIVPPTSIDYPNNSGGRAFTLVYEGTVTVTRPQMQYTPATRSGNLTADCKAEACVSEVNGGSAVSVNLTVKLYPPGALPPEPAPYAFGIAANLGGLMGQASYKAPADG